MAKTTIEFSETAIAQLDQLADTLHTTKSDILRNALSLYAYIVYQLEGQPDKMLGIVNESQGSKVEKLLAVPGVQLANAKRRVAS
jgi:Ribbon-helix-helix protein, copG family